MADVRRQKEDGIAWLDTVNERYEDALALLLMDGIGGQGNPPAAEDYLRRAAVQRHVAAQHALGLLLFAHAQDGTERLDGLYWLGAAAHAGDGFPAASLAIIHARGLHGVHNDVCLAHDWFQAAFC